MAMGSGGWMVAREMLKGTGAAGGVTRLDTTPGLVVAFGFACLLTWAGWPGTLAGLALLTVLVGVEPFQDRVGRGLAWRKRVWVTFGGMWLGFVLSHLAAYAVVRALQPDFVAVLERTALDVLAVHGRAASDELMQSMIARDDVRELAERALRAQPNQARYVASMIAMGFSVMGFRLSYDRWVARAS